MRRGPSRSTSFVDVLHRRESQAVTDERAVGSVEARTLGNPPLPHPQMRKIADDSPFESPGRLLLQGGHQGE